MIPLLENNRSIYQGGGNRGSIVKGIHFNIHNAVMTALYYSRICYTPRNRRTIGRSGQLGDPLLITRIAPRNAYGAYMTAYRPLVRGQ